MSKSAFLADTIKSLGCELDQEETFNFLAEQLRLFTVPPNRRRFSVETLILAFTLFHKSNACYTELQNTLCLPSKRMLRDISSNLSVNAGAQCEIYLEKKATLLKQHEKLVNLQLDEIHIKPKISYQAGQIVGSADNQKEEAATRIQAFMISSIMSKNKDIVSLVPVAKMTGDYLFELITKVIINVTNAGFTVNSVISDNNVINRKAFMLLSKTNSLQSYFLNPVNNSRIYILFDSVLKCIRNNWLNMKSNDKTFGFPDIDNCNLIHKASFYTLDKLYEMEKGSTIKKAYMLNYKSIHPHSIERQNVKLALRIFHVNNAAALRTLGPHNETLSNWQGTALFIDYILKFWNIFNVKTTVEGIHKRLPDCDPIRSINSHQMIWMAKFVSWLQSWKLYSMNHPNSFLTNETFIALSHTVKTVLVMIPDLLQHHNLKYILLSKFQTDNLEGRFGLYRQLSGCNYLVSVKDVMYSERKLKIKGLLRLFSSSKGVLTVSDFIASFSDIKTNKQDSSFI